MGSSPLLGEFEVSAWFCQAPERPGFVSVDSSAGPLIPVFSSTRQLAAFAGPVGWFSTTGADLLDLVPAGFRFVLDPAGDNPVILDPSATRRVLSVEPVR